MLSYTTTTNGLKAPAGKDYFLNVYSDEKVKADIEKYRDKVDLLMIAMHWGEEYTHKPVYEQTRIANYLASLDVDIIIGAHPHVVEPIEKIGKTLVIYSLGNFISAQQGINKLTGLMVSVNITKDFDSDTITIDDIEAELLYTLKNYKIKRGFKVYPYTMLNDEILPNYQKYYNNYMNVVIGNNDWIKRGDYSGNSK
jgi:poly-gamma-glutamate synthesis protein (capsule biosynthesis protein)